MKKNNHVEVQSITKKDMFEKLIDKYVTEKGIIIFLGVLLFVTSMIDMLTAFTSPIFKLAETNPIYVTYGVIPLTILTFVWMYVIIKGLQKSVKMIWIFAFVMACLFLSYGHILGAQSNVKATAQYRENPELVMEKIAQLTPEIKVNSYTTFMFDRILYPYMIDVLGFFIFYYLFYQRKSERDRRISEATELLMKAKDL